MARDAGISHMTYVAYEQGKSVPPRARRRELATALGVTRDALEELIEEDAYEVFLRSRPLSEEGRSAVRDFLRLVRERERQRPEGKE